MVDWKRVLICEKSEFLPVYPVGMRIIKVIQD